MIDDARTLFLLEMTHWCCCCRCNCRCFSAPRQWKLFSSLCLLVERPHEEHVRNLSACTRLTAKAFLSVSMWLIDLVIVIATVDISTRFPLIKLAIIPSFSSALMSIRPFFSRLKQFFPSKLKSCCRLGHTGWQLLIQTSASKQYQAWK